MLALLQTMTDFLEGLVGSPWLWAVVFLVSALDALLPFMPSETTVIAVGVLVAPDPARLAGLIVLAACGAWCGDALGYTIGRQSGPAVLPRLIKDERGQRRHRWAQEQLFRHGVLLITAGRYVPGVRAATMLTAGALRYPVRRFLVVDAIGAAVWASYSALLGYLGGTTFHDRPVVGMLMSFAIGLAVAGLIEVARRVLVRRRARIRVAPRTRSSARVGGGR